MSQLKNKLTTGWEKCNPRKYR